MYRERIQPMTMVIHAPSFEQVVERVVLSTDKIPRGLEALLFAIYSMAILSLTDDECKAMLGQSRGLLLQRYNAATKAALARAKFMSTTSLIVLQAAVLHLFAIRDNEEPRAVWCFTGLLMRISDAMGLRVDGTLLGLSPFETEIRRRIWWQLKSHDARAAELAGQAKFLDFKLDNSTPHLPVNVNEADLSPTMKKAAVGSDGLTEMIWIMFRAELGEFASKVKSRMEQLTKSRLTQESFGDMQDLALKDKLSEEAVNRIEMKYMRFCNPTIPLQFMCLLGGRIAINVIKLMSHHPRRWARLTHVPDSERKLVWDASIQLADLYHMQQTTSQIHQFAWAVPYYIQWHSIIHILDTLRAEPFHAEAKRGWQLIDATYANNLEMLLRVDRPIYVAVGNLCLKTFDACVAKGTRSLHDTPVYIMRLREQRETARARQQKAMAKSGRRQAADKSTTASADVGSREITAETSVSSGKAAQPSSAAQPAQSLAETPDFASWLGAPLDTDSTPSSGADWMDLDMSYNPIPDTWFDPTNDRGVDWAHWDALFSGGGQMGLDGMDGAK